MTSDTLRQRSMIFSSFVFLAVVMSGCGSASDGSSASLAPSSSSSTAPSPSAESDSSTDEADTSDENKEAGTASNKAVCKKVEPALNELLNGLLSNADANDRTALNALFADFADTAREQAEQASKAKMRTALNKLADATDAYQEVDDLATAEKEGDAFQKAVKRTGSLCGA